MAQFDQSRWAESEFSKNFREEADIYLPFRRQFIAITKQFYNHFLACKTAVTILDLGCGDGLFIQELLQSFSPAKIVLVDGSAEMLTAAGKRLDNQPNVTCIQTSFQELLVNDPLHETFDFIYSSLAIHHLPFAEKKKLYGYIHAHLSSGGYFVHYDVVLPRSAELEKWYLSLWRQWIKRHPEQERREELSGIPEQFKGNPDNTPDTLESQLKALQSIGFKEVDCYYKYGMFCLFGGRK
jgi:tRNA (cmo5U34)-methyltransferase